MVDLERFDPAMTGKIAYEHWHRYAICRDHCQGKEVLDVASGEGYGAAFLAENAARVVGLEIDDSTVLRARSRYHGIRNLSFETGDCRKLPFHDEAFDLVVSMETFEHIVEQQLFVAEVKRVLRPQGLFIVSTPNRAIYSEENGQNNPFHMHEVDGPEFIELLSPHFSEVELLGQRLYIGSIIGPSSEQKLSSNDRHYSAFTGWRDRRGRQQIANAPLDVEHPEYFVAFCSDTRVDWPVERHSIYAHEADDLWREKEKILIWASGLHQETEIVRRDYAAQEVETNAARREVERLTVALGASQGALARRTETIEAHLPLIRSAAHRAGLEFDGRTSLEDVVRVLSAVDRACELAGERQAGLEAREALMRQTTDALRDLVDQTRRDLERSRDQTAMAFAMRDQNVRHLEEMLSEIARLREDVSRHDADLSEARDEAAARRREAEAAQAKVVAGEAREAAFALEREQQQRKLAGFADMEEELSATRARVAELETRHAALNAEAAFSRGAVQVSDQKHAETQDLDGEPGVHEGSSEKRTGAGQAGWDVGLVRSKREATLREHLQQEHLKRRRLEVVLRDEVSLNTEQARDLRKELDATRRIDIDFIHAELAEVLAGQAASGERRERTLQDVPAKIVQRARKAADEGDAARNAKDYRLAAQHYDRALRLAPDWSAIWVQYGHMLKEQGDRAGGETAYLRAIALTPGDGDVHRQLGHVRKLSGDLKGALEAYARAAELDPWLEDIQRELHETTAQVERGRLSANDQQQFDAARDARDRGDKKAAAEAIGQLLRRAPMSATLWFEYGRTLREDGHGTAAIRALVKAIGLLPRSADTWRLLGETLASLDDEAGARIALRRALALQPASQELQDRVASLGEGDETVSLASRPVAELGRPERGLADLADWPELDPAYWLPQRLRDLLIDRYGEAVLPRFIYSMGLVDRFADRPDTFRPDTDGRHLIEVITRAAIRQDRGEVRASIIIPVHNNLVYTLTCLASILDDSGAVPFEIIVGDDRSDDDTFAVLSGIGGCVRVVRHDSNLGFLLNCNATAAFARGQVVVMLNNDTLVLPGWLDALIGTFDRYPDAGFVGSKLLNGDGSLQEAGGIFWKDGSAWNFGRNAEPRAPEFNYVKDVDYVSGASIAVPTMVWTELGGFDPTYSPAYCEDADLAFRVRERGLRTLYQPHSALIHHEGRSHGRDLSSGIKAYQVVNQRKLFERWRSTLEREHFPNAEQVFVARDRSRRKPHLLLIDHYIPQWDRDAGSRSIYLYLKLFCDRGFHVTFWPDNLYEDREYITELQDMGIEVIYSGDYAGQFSAWLRERKHWIDYAFVSRPHIAQHYLGALREAGSKVIFYGHDLHFRRTLKEYDITGDTALLARAADEQILEEKVWSECDVILYPSISERDEVRKRVPASKGVGQIPVTFIPEADLSKALARLGAPAQEETYRLMFVGGFGHPPNVDAMVWFVGQVMPKLRRQGGFVLNIAGSNAPQVICDLAADDVRILGRLSDEELDALYAKSSVALIPLRYGAGVKGKLIEALTKGVPIVATSTGVQGIEEPETIALVADDPHLFARQVLRATGNRSEAVERARRGVDYVRRHYSESSAVDALAPYIPELADWP